MQVDPFGFVLQNLMTITRQSCSTVPRLQGFSASAQPSPTGRLSRDAGCVTHLPQRCALGGLVVSAAVDDRVVFVEACRQRWGLLTPEIPPA